jgi:serine-type D-Ala-D-Ala carboxypeptidase (penicillin-binding protein 5/6)
MNWLTKKPISIIIITGLIVMAGNFYLSRNQPTNNDESALATSTGISAIMQDEITHLPEPSVVFAKRPDQPPKVYAKSYIVIDSATKYPLAAKQADTSVPIASTTKIMTAVVSLETLPLDKVVTVSSKAATIEGSDMHLLTGEKMTVKNLLYGLMLNSGNDAARALSEANGTTDDFVAKMNATAQKIGLRNTHYADPAGLDDQSKSSARDLALLMDYALTNQTFRAIVHTDKHTIWSADNKYIHELNNSNRLIHADEPLYLPATIGGKTGFTYEAGHCLVAAAEVEGKRYVAAVLFTNEDTKDASAREARKLLAWAIEGVK